MFHHGLSLPTCTGLASKWMVAWTRVFRDSYDKRPGSEAHGTGGAVCAHSEKVGCIILHINAQPEKPLCNLTLPQFTNQKRNNASKLRGITHG